MQNISEIKPEKKAIVVSSRFYGATGRLSPEDRTMRRIDMERCLFNWLNNQSAPMAHLVFGEKEFADSNALYQCALNVVNHSMKGRVEVYYNSLVSKHRVTIIRVQE